MNEWRAPASTIQQRIGAIQDRMRVKLVGNTEYNIADATDCVRLRARQTYEGDTTSWICERADVINAIFPPMKDVPFRKIRKKGERTTQYELTSLVSQFDDGEQKKNYTITVPLGDDIDVEDLLFRIIDVGDHDYSVVILLQVKELTADFAHSRVLIQKCGCVIPTEPIPPEIVETMVMVAKRRSLLGF